MEPHSLDTIVCPRCEAPLAAAATHCDRCGADTVSGQPPPGPTGKKGRLLDRPWVIIVVLLHVGLLGIPLYWKTKYSLATRLLIVAASIVYTVAAVIAIIWLGALIIRSFQQLML